jgi:hypothetical protein
VYVSGCVCTVFLKKKCSMYNLYSTNPERYKASERYT